MMSSSSSSSSRTTCCKKRFVADVVLTKALLVVVVVIVFCSSSFFSTVTNNLTTTTKTTTTTTTTTTTRARTFQKACYYGISVVNAFTITTTITTPIQRRVYYNSNNHSHRQQSTIDIISNNNNSNNNILYSLTKPSLLLSHHHQQKTKLFLFKRLRNKLTSSSESDDSSSTSSKSDSKNDSVVTSSSSTAVVEDKLSSSKSNSSNNNNKNNNDDDDSVVTDKQEEAKTLTTTAVIKRPSSSSSTNEAVDKLRKEASKIRMEAERMDILLTLDKINVLERKIKDATSKGNEEDIQKVEEQINTLKRKLNTSEEKATSTTRPKVKTDSYQIASFSKDKKDDKDNDASSSGSSSSNFISNNDNVDDKNNDTSSSIELLTKDEIQKRVEQFESVPKFLQLLVAKAAGFDKDLSNTTAIILKMHQDEVEMESLIGETTASGKQKIMIKGKKNNSETSKGLVGLMNDLQKESEEEETDEDRIETMMESLYPKSLKEYGGGSNSDKSGEIINPMPSEEDIQNFIKIINQPKIFIVQTKPPEKTSMGYIVRGVNKLKNGTSLIEHIDELVQSKFDNILRYWYINDPTPVTEEQVLSGERDPILLVSGYNSVGSTSPYEKFQWKIGRSIITSMGIFTTIFYTIFPFFFNEKVANRVDEILNLAGSTQQITPSQLSWFTELQSPLLLSMFLVIVSHEIGHWLVSISSESKFQISLPTLAPSPIFGLMSSITRLKTSPKNRVELIDFALCGPWFGIIVSSFLLSYGLDLTVTATPEVAEYFPALPISFIQASSLISSIVDQTLHNGILNSNGMDPSTPIYLHPYAIAGYAGLMINALNLTPFGRTDGGRIALCMFGRTGAQILSLITLVVLLFAGLIGNDSFLTYFLFSSFFQGELDIPLKDETDELDFIRICLGLITSAFVLLTLIPV